MTRDIWRDREFKTWLQNNGKMIGPCPGMENCVPYHRDMVPNDYRAICELAYGKVIVGTNEKGTRQRMSFCPIDTLPMCKNDRFCYGQAHPVFKRKF